MLGRRDDDARLALVEAGGEVDRDRVGELGKLRIDLRAMAVRLVPMEELGPGSVGHIWTVDRIRHGCVPALIPASCSPKTGPLKTVRGRPILPAYAPGL